MTGLNFWHFLQGLARIVAARPRVPRALEGNAVLRTVLERRSVREFRPDPIDDDAWAAILEAGRVAPSTVNLQTWAFGVFTADQWQAFFGQPVPFGAARAVIVLADTHRMRRVVEGFPRAPLCEHTVGVMNASLAAMNMTIAAEALGIASVMLSETGRTGFYDAGFLAGKLELPAGVVPIMSIAFGYAKGGAPAMPPKLPLEAIIFTGAVPRDGSGRARSVVPEQQAGYQASNWGTRFAQQIAYYNRRLLEAERDLETLIRRERAGRLGAAVEDVAALLLQLQHVLQVGRRDVREHGLAAVGEHHAAHHGRHGAQVGAAGVHVGGAVVEAEAGQLAVVHHVDQGAGDQGVAGGGVHVQLAAGQVRAGAHADLAHDQVGAHGAGEPAAGAFGQGHVGARRPRA